MNDYTTAFSRLWEWQSTRAQERDAYVGEINAQLVADCQAAYRRRFPRRAFSMVKSRDTNTTEHTVIFERLKIGHRRSYVAARAPLWMIPGGVFFQRKRKMPFYLVQIGAGLGQLFDDGLVRAARHACTADQQKRQAEHLRRKTLHGNSSALSLPG